MTNQPGAAPPGQPNLNTPGSAGHAPSHPAEEAPFAAARQFSEPLRELSVFALLAANGVFLLLGIGELLVAFDGWASEFGRRCDSVFATFVGPLALAMPVAALLLATHVTPMVRRSRLALVVILTELTVSAIFGVMTFLGAFAYDLTSIRATLEGLLSRGVWLSLLALAALVSIRVWLGLSPATAPGVYRSYGQPVYGRPYPGQPRYPAGTAAQPPAAFQPGKARPGQPGTRATSMPTDDAGWPVVPPPPMPIPRADIRAPQRPAPPGQPSAALTGPASPAPMRLAATTLELPPAAEAAGADPGVDPEPARRVDPDSQPDAMAAPPPFSPAASPAPLVSESPSHQDGR